MSVAVAAFMFAYVFAPTAAAQIRQTRMRAARPQTRNLKYLPKVNRWRKSKQVDQPGPLAGTEVETRSTGQDPEVEIIIIPRTDCTFEQGASFVLKTTMARSRLHRQRQCQDKTG